MKIIVSYTPEIDDKSESVSSIKVCCIHRALSFSKSFEDLFLHISCLHSLTVNLTEIPLATTFTSVMSEGVKRSHCLSHQRHTARKQKNSLHWCSHWWWCLTPYLLSLSRDEWLASTWTSSISVVRKVLTNKFLTVNDFILKLDVSQLLGELCFVRSYHSIACRCKLELEKELIRKNSWKEDSMIL